MNSKLRHRSKEDLAAFVTGRLTEVETETILAHLETCERCLMIVDGFWEEGNSQVVDSDRHLDKDSAAQIEERLYGRIHRSQLAGDVITLGTRGMLEMVFALLAPFTEMLSSSRSRSKKSKERK